jgi:hypothetical protein
MSGIREPNLPAPSDGALRALILETATALQRFTPQRDPRVSQMIYMQPTELFALLSDLVRQLGGFANSYKNGSTVRSGSEPAGWNGSAAAGSDSALVARFSAKHGNGAEPIVRAALAAHADLMRQAGLGLKRITVERYVKLNLAAAGFGSADDE